MAGVSITPQRVRNALPGSEAVFAHVLANLGSGTDTFDVTAATPRGWTTRVFHDVDGDGALGAADTLLTDPVTLGTGATLPLLVATDVPAGTGQGEVEPVDVTAKSRIDPAATDALTNQVQVDGFDTGVSVQKVVDQATASPDELLTYTIQAQITGSDAADELILRDTIPAGLSYVSGTVQVDGVLQTDGADTDLASYTSATRVVEVRLASPAAGTVTAVFQARIDASVAVGSTLSNTAAAELKLPGGVTRTDASTASTTIDPAAPEANPAEVSIQKYVDRESAEPGDVLTYTIVAMIQGPGAVQELRIRDFVPNGTTYEPGSLTVSGPAGGGGGFNAVTGQVEVSVNNPVAGTTEVTFRARVGEAVPLGTRITNTARATIHLADGSAKGAANEVVTVVDVLKLDIVKTVSGPDTATYGDTLIYQIEVQNTSRATYAAAGIVVDTLPEHLTVITPGPRVSVTQGRIVTWRLPGLGPGGKASLSLVTRVGEPTDTVSITNRAHVQVRGKSYGEAESGAVVLVPAGPPALLFSKSVTGPNPATPGTILLYELEVVNTDAERTAMNIDVVDVLPSILRSLETTPAAEIEGQVHSWTIDRLAPGETARFQIRTRVRAVDETMQLVNHGFLRNGSDPIGEAESETITIIPSDPTLDPVEVSVDKRVDRTTATRQDMLEYTIVAQVEGSSPVVELVLRDELPSGVTYEPGSLRFAGEGQTDGLDADAGTYDPATRVVEFRLDTPTAGVYTASFQARVDASAPLGARIENVAVAELLSPAPGVKSATGSAVTILSAPDIAVRKTVTAKSPSTAGDTVLYAIEVENTSSDLLARDLEVLDTLPQYLTALSTAPAAEESDAGVLRWFISTLEPGAVRRFEVVTEVGSVPDSVLAVNRAHLLSGGEQVGGAEAEGVGLISPDTARLALDLSAEVIEVQVGEVLPLLVDVTNTGIVTVSNVRVTLSIPTGTEFVNEILNGSFTASRASPTAGVVGFASPGPSGAPDPDPGVSTGAGFATQRLQVDSFQVMGDSLVVWIPGELRPQESFNFRYQLLIESPPSNLLQMNASAEGRRGNFAVSSAGRVVASNADAVQVVLGRNRPLETRTAIGKVFIDEDDNGIQDVGEPGMAGVEIWTEDGEVVTTDADGKFSFNNLRPGRHVFRIDELTLPPEFAPGGLGIDRGLKVLETNGWNTGRLSFPLVSRVAEVIGARAQDGASDETCRTLEAVISEVTAKATPRCTFTEQDSALASEATVLEADTPLLPQPIVAPDSLGDLPPAGPADVASDAAPAVVLVELALRTRTETVYQPPAAWTYVPGSARSAGTAREPEELLAPDGSRWLVWPEHRGDSATVTLLLARSEDMVLVAEDPIMVESARTQEERETEGRQTFLSGPGIEIFAPMDGSVAPSHKLFIGVKGEASRPVSLFRNDSLVAEVTLRPDGVHDFIGIDLAPGPQTFRVRTENSWGRERWDSVRVHRSGDPAALVPVDERLTLVADGQTVVRTRVRVLDAWGVPVVNRPQVTVHLDGGRFVSTDATPGALGHQVEADSRGWVEIDLVGETTTGRGTMRVTVDSLEVLVPLTIQASVRPLFLTGVGQVGMGASGENFGALTARGRLNDETSLTLSYDSRRLDQGRNVFGRSSDPLEDGRYTVIGDASQQRSLNSSRYRFAARVERGTDWLMLGDVQSSGFSNGLGLASYARSVRGGAAQVTTGGVTWNAFGASTTQALRQVQVRGNGTSGPFEFGAGMLPGTEQVKIEVRARENATRIITQQPLQRFIDYEIDYERGTLLLKRPAPSTDPSGNPIFLVVTYEGESGGSESMLWGVRANGDLTELLGAVVDSVPVSVMVVSDHQPGSEFRMGAVQLGLAQESGASLTAEIAFTDMRDSSDVATRIGGELPLLDDRVRLSAQWTRIGDEFNNPSNVSAQAGSEELRAAGEVKAGSALVTLSHEKQDFASLDLDRSRSSVAISQELTSSLSLDGLLADTRATRGTQESKDGATELRLNWQAASRLRLFAEAREQLWSEGTLGNTGSYYGGGAAFKLTDKIEFEGRHLRVSPSGSQTPYSVSSIGVVSNIAGGTKAWGNYQLRGAANAQTNAAVLGLNHQFELGPNWRFQTMVERRQGVASANVGDPVLTAPFEQREDDYLSGAVGGEFLPQDKPYRLSFRAESKSGTNQSSSLASLAGELAFDASLALLSRQEYLTNTSGQGDSERYTRQRSSLWGLAYRPTATDDLNVLFKLHWKDAVNPFGTGVLTQDGEESRLVGALEAIWAPRADFELGARVAARRTRSQGPVLAGAETIRKADTRFLGVRALATLNDWSKLKVEVRAMSTNVGAGSVWDIAPGVVFRPIEGLEIEGGYRFGDLQDPDFAVKTGNGWYLSIGTRFTEKLLPTAAAFWRDRFGR